KQTAANKELTRSEEEKQAAIRKAIDENAQSRTQFAGAAKTADAGSEEAQDAAKQARLEAQKIQQQAIVSMKLEALQLEAAGDTAAAAALNREIEQRTVALALQKQLNVSEAEALALATQAVEAEQFITLQKESQAALNEELVAQEAARLEVEAVHGALAGANL